MSLPATSHRNKWLRSCNRTSTEQKHSAKCTHIIQVQQSVFRLHVYVHNATLRRKNAIINLRYWILWLLFSEISFEININSVCVCVVPDSAEPHIHTASTSTIKCKCYLARQCTNMTHARMHVTYNGITQR